MTTGKGMCMKYLSERMHYFATFTSYSSAQSGLADHYFE